MVSGPRWSNTVVFSIFFYFHMLNSPIRMRKVDNGRNEAFCVFVSMTMLRCYLVSSPAISNPRPMYRTQVWNSTAHLLFFLDTIKVRHPLQFPNLCSQGRRRRGAGGGGHEPPTFKSGGAQVGLCPPPTFGQSKCSNFTICSYFVV